MSALHTAARAALLSCLALASIAFSASPEAPSWGAIASVKGLVGYSFNQPTRDAAETVARAQCDRAAGRQGACAVRAFFDRSCGALATGTFGEWGLATASTENAAGKAAAEQCDAHLPTEPCKVVVKVCSPR